MKKLYVLLSLLSLIFLSACMQVNPDPTPVNGLNSLASQAEFQELVKPYLQNDRLTSFAWFRTAEFSMTDAIAVSSAVPESDQAEVSETNVQIEGVDEGDIIKVDANRIYRIDGSRFDVVAINKGQMTLIYQETLSSESDESGHTYFSDLYLTEKYVVVIGQRYDFYQALESDEIRILPIFRFGTPFTLIKILDKDTLETVDTFEISGSLNTSRLIDQQLYVLSTHSVYSLEDDFDPRPVIKLNGEETVPDYADIKYIDNVPTEAFSMISHVDLSADPVLETEILLGSMGWAQVYVNLEGIYFTDTRYIEVVPATFGRGGEWVQQGQLISYTFNEDGSLSFGGLGTFKGWVQNQFWMDEYEGFFRLVTTDGWGDDVVNRLYVFERKTTDQGPTLEVVSEINEGLGKPRETVRSVRFQGPLATVVTFEMTDPLYTIDLTDPYNPEILAGLEITGFATYQHPWDNDTLIGIGYETDLEGIIIGLKLTLFDISDWENPVEIGEPLVLLSGRNRWQFSEALHNHKAILIAKNKDFIGFSVGHSRFDENTYSTSQDYLIFTIDASLDQPIQIAQTLNHDALVTDETQNNWGFQLERAVYVDDVLYLISSLGVSSYQISSDFEVISQLSFE